MPIYEYTCQTCHNTFEKLRSVSQMDDDAPCPDCASPSQRQLSVFASFSVSSDGELAPVGGGGGGCGSGACCGGGCSV